MVTFSPIKNINYRKIGGKNGGPGVL